MSKIQIMTDSASDISYEDEKKYSISVIPFPVTLGGQTYLSRVDFDNQQFYDLMAQHDEIPKTAQITPFQFQEIYLREASSGVTVRLASTLSGVSKARQPVSSSVL